MRQLLGEEYTINRNEWLKKCIWLLTDNYFSRIDNIFQINVVDLVLVHLV